MLENWELDYICENGKVLVSNVFERVEVGDKIYKLYNLNTKSKTMNTQEYIESVDGKNLIWKYILPPLL